MLRWFFKSDGNGETWLALQVSVWHLRLPGDPQAPLGFDVWTELSPCNQFFSQNLNNDLGRNWNTVLFSFSEQPPIGWGLCGVIQVTYARLGVDHHTWVKPLLSVECWCSLCSAVGRRLVSQTVKPIWESAGVPCRCLSMSVTQGFRG
jgi:hypothetical protein